MSDTIKIHSPNELVSTIPALLGFEPEEDLVALWLRDPDGVLTWTMRVDIGLPSHEISRRLLDLATRTGPGRLLLVWFTDDQNGLRPEASPDSVGDLLEVLETATVAIQDAMLITPSTVTSYLCDGPGCCPDFPASRGGVSELELRHVVAGLPRPAASRQELEERFMARPWEAPSPAAMEAAEGLQEAPLSARCQLAVVALDEVGSPDDEDARACLAVLTRDVNVRDWLLSELATGQEPTTARVDALVRLARTAPEGDRDRLAGTAAAALTLQGMNPVGAWAMVELAGSDSLARLVALALDHALSPDDLREVLAQARQELEHRLNETEGAA
jgi:hypothetical protein